ncbi:MAG TPA: TonB-dependent receptor [Gemmatimonadales bacterium]|jgi:vitamin B12 transporter|nr:TonB-dependent receptor [Gemmatimonadales bacterium]
MNVALLALALTIQQPQDTVVLKPIVVTATRTPVSAELVPSAVTVLRGVDLVAQGIRTVADALEMVPGAHIVETGSYGGQTSLFMRGGESDYVKLLLDGVPLNQAGGGIDLAHLTTDNIDRIEIVRGPVSVLYGSDAMTGVVQIFTRSGGGSHITAPQLGAELRAGTYDSRDGALDIVGGTRTFSYSARASQFSSDGLYPYNNHYRNRVASARLRVMPDSRTDASLTYRYGDDLYHFPTNGQGAPVDSNQRAAERGPLLSLSAGRVLGEHLEARINVALKEARQFYNDEPDSPGEDGAFWSRDYLRRSSVGAFVTWRNHDKINVISGVEYEDERQRGRSEFTTRAGPPFPDSIAVQRNNTGYFTQAVIGAGRASVTLGGRVDDNSEFGSHGTYRAGVVYRLAAGTRLRASAGTGFKEPTFFENFARGSFRGNPYLKPESSKSWEVGVEHTLKGGHARAAVTYFNQRFQHLIDFTSNPVPPDSFNYFNVGGASADGVELSVAFEFNSGGSAKLTYDYLRTRVENPGFGTGPDAAFSPGRRLLRRPTHGFVQETVVPIGNRLRATLMIRFVGDRDDLDFSQTPAGRLTLPPYSRVNVSAEYRPLNRVAGLSLSVRVENLFNNHSSEITNFRVRGRLVIIGCRTVLAL